MVLDLRNLIRVRAMTIEGAMWMGSRNAEVMEQTYVVEPWRRDRRGFLPLAASSQ